MTPYPPHTKNAIKCVYLSDFYITKTRKDDHLELLIKFL